MRNQLFQFVAERKAHSRAARLAAAAHPQSATASISTSHSDSASAETPMRVLAGGVPFAKKGARALPIEQPAIRSFAPARTPKIRARAIRSPASAQLPQHSRRRQIPIAPAALSVPHTPRFRALALFGRRLLERGDAPGMPASENLHTATLTAR
jgi:hypothetical protein